MAIRVKAEGHCRVDVGTIDGNDYIDDHTGKLCMRLEINDAGGQARVFFITTNLAEMLGGVGAGTRERQEDAANAKR